MTFEKCPYEDLLCGSLGVKGLKKEKKIEKICQKLTQVGFLSPIVKMYINLGNDDVIIFNEVIIYQSQNCVL